MVICVNNKNRKIFFGLRNIKVFKDQYKYIDFFNGNWKYFYMIFLKEK